MLATPQRSRTNFLVLIFCLIGSAPAYPQGAVSITSTKTPNNRTSSGAWLAKCDATRTDLFGVWRFNYGNESPAIPGGVGPDSNVLGASEEVCLGTTWVATPQTPIENPCRQSVTDGSAVLRSFPCSETEDTVPAELSTQGKAGAKIARAREEVLEILRSQNACTEWFESKDTNVAATFQSIDFLVDQHGPQDIFESPAVESIVIFHQPYVARAIQDGGAHTTITINANGAFFRSQGQVQKVPLEGGPQALAGARLLTVGSYSGAGLAAQMVTLLHELGHIIDLLPEDADNLDGKSVRNTDEVLRHCRAEVEARAQQAKQTAKR